MYIFNGLTYLFWAQCIFIILFIPCVRYFSFKDFKIMYSLLFINFIMSWELHLQLLWFRSCLGLVCVFRFFFTRVHSQMRINTNKKEENFLIYNFIHTFFSSLLNCFLPFVDIIIIIINLVYFLFRRRMHFHLFIYFHIFIFFHSLLTSFVICLQAAIKYHRKLWWWML